MVAQGTREASPCAFFVYPFSSFRVSFLGYRVWYKLFVASLQAPCTVHYLLYNEISCVV